MDESGENVVLDEDIQIGANELALEYSKYDLAYGPFLTFNLIY
jgi:hypothetical protein